MLYNNFVLRSVTFLYFLLKTLTIFLCFPYNNIYRFCSVQKIDGQYFESFTALAWKQESQRQNSLKKAESTAAELPPQEMDLGITPIDYSTSQIEKDKLYVEMLYTIANAVRNINCLIMMLSISLYEAFHAKSTVEILSAF